MNTTPAGFPDFLPDQVPDGVLFLVAGIDYAALGMPAAAGIPVGVQIMLNGPPGLAVTALRAAADSIAAEAKRDRDQAGLN